MEVQVEFSFSNTPPLPCHTHIPSGLWAMGFLIHNGKRQRKDLFLLQAQIRRIYFHLSRNFHP